MNDKEKLMGYWKRTEAIKSKKVLKAFKEVKRELFIPEKIRNQAYWDTALPIPSGQTISQPSTVMLMLDLLDVKPKSKILEIGVGSGYNAALLSKLTKGKIIAVERIGKLAEYAKKNLEKAKIKRVKIIHADGTEGHAKEAPYDRIIATCGSPSIPNAWKDQLKEGGILVAPIGCDEQEMIVIRKAKGKLNIERRGLFRFVPLLKGKE